MKDNQMTYLTIIIIWCLFKFQREAMQAGDKLHVQTCDGRTIEATIPSGNVKEFYLRVPPPPQQHHVEGQEQACSPFGALGAIFGMTD
jgi:hypothetical protein